MQRFARVEPSSNQTKKETMIIASLGKKSRDAAAALPRLLCSAARLRQGGKCSGTAEDIGDSDSRPISDTVNSQ